MSDKRLYAVRGATTVAEDTREAIVAATQAMLRDLLDRNEIEQGDIVSVLLTATDDLHAEFPAAAVRAMGLAVPLMCARELDVPNSPLTIERCVRVLMHFYGMRVPEPVYLEGAVRLLEQVRADARAVPPASPAGR